MAQIGCSPELEAKSAAISFAGEHIAKTLRQGSTPGNWVIQGTSYTVVVPSITADGSTDQQAAIQSALTNASGPTLVVISPADVPYACNSALTVGQADLYLLGYDATLLMTATASRVNINANHCGVLGLQMRTPSSSWSTWMSRWIRQADKTVNPSKDSGLQTGDAEYFYCDSRSNIILKDNDTRGGRGGVRLYFSSEVLIEGNRVAETESDGIHVTKNSHQVTVRGNTVLRCGDDLISVVGYNRLEAGNDTPPTGILIERNQVCWGRARGLSIHGGDQVVHRENHVSHTLRSGIYYSAEKYAENPAHDVTDVTAERNILESVDLLQRSDPANGWVCALAYGDGQTYTNSGGGNTGPQTVSGVVLTDNICIHYGTEMHNPATDFFQSSPGSNSGVVAPTISGTVVTDWSAA